MGAARKLIAETTTSTAQFTPAERRFMERALALAARGAGKVAPNPMVGCVLAQGRASIVGEGWHKGAGLAHAEVEAIKAAGDQARGATAFVTLEPCNHTGRTGPCSQVLIEAGVSEVIYALADPHPIAGGGAQRLRQAGLTVRGGLCEREARHLNRAWLFSLKSRRPFVIAKTAISLDGRIATSAGESQWITGPAARAEGHQFRAGAEAIITGAGTVIADDPALSARSDGDIAFPLRVVMDTTARTPPGAKVYERSGRGAILAVGADAPEARLSAFREMGVEILSLGANEDGRPDPDSLLAALYERGVVTAMIEAGGQTLGAFFDADLIDEIAIFVAPKLIGGGAPAFGGTGVSSLADASRFTFTAPTQLGEDLFYYGVRNREAF